MIKGSVQFSATLIKAHFNRLTFMKGISLSNQLARSGRLEVRHLTFQAGDLNSTHYLAMLGILVTLGGTWRVHAVGHGQLDGSEWAAY